MTISQESAELRLSGYISTILLSLYGTAIPVDPYGVPTRAWWQTVLHRVTAELQKLEHFEDISISVGLRGPCAIRICSEHPRNIHVTHEIRFDVKHRTLVVFIVPQMVIDLENSGELNG